MEKLWGNRAFDFDNKEGDFDAFIVCVMDSGDRIHPHSSVLTQILDDLLDVNVFGDLVGVAVGFLDQCDLRSCCASEPTLGTVFLDEWNQIFWSFVVAYNVGNQITMPVIGPCFFDHSFAGRTVRDFLVITHCDLLVVMSETDAVKQQPFITNTGQKVKNPSLLARGFCFYLQPL